MAKVTLRSDNVTWIFEEGQVAIYLDSKGNPQDADFSVIKIIPGVPLAILTDLKGISRYGWTRIIEWGGLEYDLESD